MTDGPAFLGVESSLTGRRWIGLSPDQDRAAERLVQITGLPDAVCRTLARRGVAPEEAEDFLAPTLRALLPDPRSLRDMERAAARVNAAIARNERIAIFADYDVDGGSSAALLIDWLRAQGRTATLYVPDRIDEGYGPNIPAMEALADAHDLIICVDCGTLSHDPVAAAQGTDVVILDHHLAEECLPAAHAVVNPNRQDEDGSLSHLCAAAVVFLLLVEANRQQRAAGQPGQDLMALLDLVALATVADVAPLSGVNRAFVRQGLTVMGRRERPGLTALSDSAGLDRAPSSYHLGFVLGPRINAGGRIGAADLGARLLATRDPHEAAALAERLEKLNAERRDIEAQVRASALEQAETRGLNAPLAWAAGEGWHPGVVGIVASRLKETANRPAIVIGLEGDEGKGSGRSVPGIDLGAAIQRLAHEGLLLKGGGHKMAAGLTVRRDLLEPAMARLSELLAAQGADRLGPKGLHVDGVLSPRAITTELITRIEDAGPFGASAPAPRFALPSVTIRYAKPVGESHLRFSFAGPCGTRMDGIAFGAFDTPIGPALSQSARGTFHLAGRLEINSWGGQHKAQLRLDDAAAAEA
ncbi:single-stranded-DNA-specific exonuclease [Dinoroseobacter shibae DFL 12 = DSM 16493]|uniref:Single-stranded-DNA-specific exonuclease RecJ n=1 Tax=Dinoroseobacter shibae (strain DSM 16493 / NCIMB 14021 / DFL 12) TaxID=398580 RepID=A8LR88_DINSH|nr:single-stranded-DNA-specific exonuclease RecJ [Dinoroseobacter shibae]ABV94011.1 single-stranded-DNA-specific exonuclease [Dinoroseobacter shibae DFL 12 = DSM 16493]URF45454.1 single-stranded-DNA-specific exonuclease RecJ [Dinoroseobacter shibae]URF49759.1 single-stranded-DNA-specific exonuclease RecJ [Dinoroseobacter shibae]